MKTFHSYEDLWLVNLVHTQKKLTNADEGKLCYRLNNYTTENWKKKDFVTSDKFRKNQIITKAKRKKKFHYLSDNKVKFCGTLNKIILWSILTHVETCLLPGKQTNHSAIINYLSHSKNITWTENSITRQVRETKCTRFMKRSVRLVRYKIKCHIIFFTRKTRA